MILLDDYNYTSTWMSKLPVLNMEFRKADSKMEPLVPVEVHFSYLRFTQTKREKIAVI